MRLLRLALPALLASVPGAAAAANLVRFEIDTIYPRNETYVYNESSPILPIAFQAQNLSHPVELGHLTLRWAIELYAGNRSISSIDNGFFHVPDDVADGGTRVLVDYTDPSRWNVRYGPDDKFVLYLYAYWGNITFYNYCITTTNCDASSRSCTPHSHNLAAVMFGLQNSAWSARDGYGNGSAVAQDITQAPTCPLFGGLYEAYADEGDGAAATASSATAAASATATTTAATCPLSAVINLRTADGAPCATPVDRAAQSSILAAASSKAYTHTHIDLPTPTHRAAAPGRDAGLAPVLAAAAAGALYGLV